MPPASDRAAEDPARYRWWVVALLVCIGALNYCDRAAISAVFPLIRADLHLSDVGLAAVGSVFLWSYAAASPLAGMMADRRSRSAVVVASLALWSLVTLATAFVAGAGQLWLTRIGLGVVEAAYLPAAMALIADHHPAQSRGTAMALHTAGLTLGAVAGGSVAGYMGQHFGWRAAFFALGLAGLLLALVARRFLRDAAAAPPPGRGHALAAELLVPLTRVPTYLFLLAGGMVAALGNNTFANWLPLYFYDTFGLSLAWAGFSGTFLVQGAGTLATLAGGMFSDRLAGHRPRRRMLLQIVSTLAAAPFLLVFFSARPDLWSVGPAVLAFFFCLKFGDVNTAPLTCELLPPRLRSTAFGLMNMANCFAGGAAVMTAGLLKRHFGLAGVFGAISVTTLAYAGILVPAYRFFLRRDLARSEGVVQLE